MLVGSARQRDRLRGELDIAADVVGEFDSVAAARESGIAADALLLPSIMPDARDDTLVAESLTPREIEVLELVAEGLPNKAIAARLAISDQTVKFHIASIIAKLGASNRTEAVRRAVGRGLMSL